MATSPEARAGSILGISAPPREKTPVLPKPDKTQAPAPTRKPEKEKQEWPKITPEEKKSRAKTKLGRIGMALGALVGIVGGAGIADHYGLVKIPALHREATVAPFDLSKLDTERQTVVIGQNGFWATSEDNQKLISSPQSKIIDSKDIKTIEDYPQISIIPSIGQGAGKIEIGRVPGGTAIIKGAPEFLKILAGNKGTEFGLPKLESVPHNATFQFFLAPGPNNILVDGQIYFTTMYAVSHYDGTYITIEMGSSVNNLATTDFTKNAPTVNDRSVGSTLEAVRRQKSDVILTATDNSALFTTTSGNVEVNTRIIIGKDIPFSGSSVLSEPVASNGSLLINPVH